MVYTMRPFGTPLHTGFVEFTSTLPEQCRVAEIGCYAGESTFWLAMRGGSIVCVDRWRDYVEDNGEAGTTTIDDMSTVESLFDHLAAQVGDRLTKIKADSLTAAEMFEDQSFDCVYLDAGHEYADIYHDIQAWRPKVKSGGLLAGHDYADDRPGVKRAVSDLLDGPDRVFPDGTWVKRITNGA